MDCCWEMAPSAVPYGSCFRCGGCGKEWWLDSLGGWQELDDAPVYVLLGMRSFSEDAARAGTIARLQRRDNRAGAEWLRVADALRGAG